MHANDVVLTATKRLATRLRHDWRLPRPMPQFIAYSDWVISLWQKSQLYASTPLPAILTDAQTLCIWESIIADSAIGTDLLKVSATAQRVANAWKLCHQWRLDPLALPFDGAEDQQAFQNWARTFLAYSSAHHSIDNARLVDFLLALGCPIGLDPSTRIFWTGFDDITPQLQYFFDTFRSWGFTLAPLIGAHNKQATAIFKIGLKDGLEEARAALQWAKNITETDASAVVAVVVPDLDTQRARLEWLAYEVFDPDFYLRNFHAPFVQRFNISGGTPLMEAPIIYAAYTLLGCLRDTMALDTLVFLLRSPFIEGAIQECDVRAAMVTDWLALGKIEWALEEILVILRQSNKTPVFVSVVEKIIAYQHDLGMRNSTGWAGFFTEFLLAVGWPGERTLNSFEYQAVAKWKETLDTYTAYDRVLSPMQVTDARSRLWALVSTVLFQVQTQTVRVQILGLLEAGGQPFSHLWMMGVSTDQWPQPSSPNPFLSYALQRHHGMPHATPQRELAFSKSMMQNFEKNVGYLVYSYPAKIEDKTAYPSSLIADYPFLPIEGVRGMPAVATPTFALENYTDHSTLLPDVLLLPPEKTGTKLFDLQSACSFRAFATLRLGAERKDYPKPYLVAAERGVLVHALLAAVWKQVKHQSALCMMTRIDLQTILRMVLDKLRFKDARYRSMSAAYWEVEVTRLSGLLLRWFDLEKDRAPFTVQSCEAALTVLIAGQPIAVRIDRIDILASGEVIIIDYKTNAVSLSDLLGDRPRSPQLLIYLLAHPAQALVYAYITPKAMGLLGVSASAMELSGIQPLEKCYPGLSWTQIQSQWMITLERLMNDFQQGIALVDPRDSTACQRCNLQGLCRVGELT